MTWTLDDMAGNPIAQVFKERGGFFVGISPECDMALGTVAYYESVQKLTLNDRRAVTIQGGNYNLVMYRETTQDNQRGKRIRSFYPEFRGGAFDPLPRPGSTPSLRPIGDVQMQTGSVVLVAALPNPEGSQSGEWVELKNTSSEQIALEGWFLTDKSGRRKMLEGTLAPDEQKQVLVRTNSPQSCNWAILVVESYFSNLMVKWLLRCSITKHLKARSLTSKVNRVIRYYWSS